MTTQEPTLLEAALAAIDVSKNSNDVLIEILDKTRRRRLVIFDARAEHDHSIHTLHGIDRPVIAGIGAMEQAERQAAVSEKITEARPAQPVRFAKLNVLTNLLAPGKTTADVFCSQVLAPLKAAEGLHTSIENTLKLQP